MRFLRPRRLLIAVLVLAVGIPVTLLLARDRSADAAPLQAQVRRGDFRVTVTTSGELRAPKYVQIQLPPNATQAQVFQGLKILSIVPEGTIVQEGEKVAEIDRSPYATKQTEVMLTLQKAEAQYEQAMLDSTLNLGKAREDMKTMEIALEEKRIAKEQAVYEAPSVKRQAELEYEKAERALAQAKVDYKTKTEQAQAKMREVGADRDRQRNLLKNIQDVMSAMTINAPAAGMVIYVKEWNGRKKTVNSTVSPWEPTVATLPDLSVMESITYVNEIDVRKLRVGQPVTVTLDADPSRKLVGTVKQVANVGEQRPNSDAKVFEVLVNIEKPDTSLRPGMTTGNEVETQALRDVLFIPLDALVVEDGIPIVFRQDGNRVVKQEVATGAMNDDEVVIVKGLEEGQTVLLSPPLNRAELELIRLPGSANMSPSGSTGDTAQRMTVPPAGTKSPAPGGSPPPARKN
ncbi:MAG: efflux RND transporter periplasmic adaptor subunit [Gemmatimonadaceae bacterium]|nr:efflux RND transporter periplasmic adaptor subunit [Gemmatimonadaceae bacterium]